jgi:hypothetical protein
MYVTNASSRRVYIRRPHRAPSDDALQDLPHRLRIMQLLSKKRRAEWVVLW